MTHVLLASYFATLAVLAGLGVYRLLLTFWASRASEPKPADHASPRVVVQLPIYNEAFVAERAVRAAAALDYDALEIQVLDDSTDETTATLQRVVSELAATGVDITLVRRDDREGYKAGALAHGLTQTDAELVAIFDADFVPAPDFLKKTVPLFDDGVGLVQARWTHLNRDTSLLTRAQAVFLDGHFGVEHRARAHTKHFFNFNGTAGVWRRQAIDDAGGWRSATITEDLDLSYRAQLKGWRFVYAHDVTAPAELPESWAAFRAQQARWVRGSIETTRLLFGEVWRSRLPLGVRLDAAIHLTNNFAYLFMAVLAALLPACVWLRDDLGWRVPGGQALLSILDLTMLTAGTFAMVVFYFAAARACEGRLSLRRIVDVVFALCLGAGMSLSNAREVLRGLASEQSEFVRTPKRGREQLTRALVRYRPVTAHKTALLELVFALYFGATIVYALYWSLWGALPFLALYAVGFSSVSLSSLREAWPRRASVDTVDEWPRATPAR